MLNVDDAHDLFGLYYSWIRIKQNII